MWFLEIVFRQYFQGEVGGDVDCVQWMLYNGDRIDQTHSEKDNFNLHRTPFYMTSIGWLSEIYSEEPVPISWIDDGVDQSQVLLPSGYSPVDLKENMKLREGSQMITNRVVCPYFEHPALTSSLQVHVDAVGMLRK